MPHIKFRILGCGTSTGVPMPGCNCQVCLSSDQKNNRLRPSALLTIDHKYNILIDATTDLRQQALSWKITHIDAVLYTHAHADHILGTDDLRCFNFTSKSKAKIPCYASFETISGIKRCFDYIFNPDPNYLGGMLAQLELIEFQAYQKLRLFNLDIEIFELLHGRTKVNGFKFGDLAYATDCKIIPDQSKNILYGIKYLILDGLRHKPHATHLTIDEACLLAQELKIQNTFLTHITHDIDYQTESAKLPANIALAYDGMIIEYEI